MPTPASTIKTYAEFMERFRALGPFAAPAIRDGETVEQPAEGAVPAVAAPSALPPECSHRWRFVESSDVWYCPKCKATEVAE